MTLGRVQVLYQRVWRGLGDLSQNANTHDALEGGGGLSQNAGMLTLWWEGVGELKHEASIIVKYLNLSMNYALISMNAAPTPQNILLMTIEKHKLKLSLSVQLGLGTSWVYQINA